MEKYSLKAVILVSVFGATLLDLSTSAGLVGSILFAFPVGLCTLQSSKSFLWATTCLTIGLTLVGQYWGFGRVQLPDPTEALVNRVLVIGSLVLLAALVHIRIDQRSESRRDAEQMESQRRELEVHRERLEGLVAAAHAEIEAKAVAETEIRRMEERFRRLLESAPDAIVIVDAEGAIQLVNAQTEQLFGYAKTELLGERVEVLIPARFLHKHEGHRSRFAHDPKFRMMGQGLELQGRRKDGTEFPVEIALAPLQTEGGLLVSAAVRDISSRKKAEEVILELNRTLEQRVAERTDELLKSEHRYHDALDAMIEGVQIIGFDWRHLYANDSLVAQSTFTREQLIGTTMMERYPGIERSELFQIFSRCMHERIPHVMDTEFIFPNGVKKAFHLSIQPVTEGLFILSTDITDRLKAEAEVNDQRKQLEQKNKELEQFAYVALHDLQEPLRMVSSYVELLQRRYADKIDSDAKEFIAFAVDGTVRMKQLITDLLTFSRLGGAVLVENVDMDRVFERVYANLSTAIAECGASVVRNDLPSVRSSETEMMQVVQNLIGNALKFRRDGVAPVIEVLGHQDGDKCTFEVRDNGIGIDERYSEKVFAPFKRLHDRSKYPGSGIGLAVAQKVVQRYGGRIWFTSTPGRGTTFRFTLDKAEP